MFKMNKEQLLRNYCNDYIANKITFDEFQALFSEISHSEIRIDGKSHKMPPEPLIFKISNTEEYPIFFPIEMRNKHYIVDLMDILREGLLLFIQKIRRKCSRLEEPEGEDVYYLLKWLKNNVKIWHPVVLPGLVEGPIVNQIFNLLNLRNSFSHQNDTMTNNRRGALKTVSTSNVDQCFQDCMNLLSTIGLCLGPGKTEFIQENMIALDKQRRLHHLYRKKRKHQSNNQQVRPEAAPQEQKVRVSFAERLDAIELLEEVPYLKGDFPATKYSNKFTDMNKFRKYIESENFDCSTSAIFKLCDNNLFFVNDRNKLEYREIDNLTSEKGTVLTKIGKINSFKIIEWWSKKYIFCLKEDSIVAFELDLLLKGSSKNSFINLDFKDLGINSNENLFEVIDCSSFISVLLIEKNGSKKNRINSISIDPELCIKIERIDIFLLAQRDICFIGAQINDMAIPNIVIISTFLNIYIICLNTLIHQKELFFLGKKRSIFGNSSRLALTASNYFIEVIVGRIDIWKTYIKWDASGDSGKVDFNMKHSIPLFEKPGIKGFFIKESELYMWYQKDNKLCISGYYDFFHTEGGDFFEGGNFTPGTIVEDLFINTIDRQIICRTKNEQTNFCEIKTFVYGDFLM